MGSIHLESANVDTQTTQDSKIEFSYDDPLEKFICRKDEFVD